MKNTNAQKKFTSIADAEHPFNEEFFENYSPDYEKEHQEEYTEEDDLSLEDIDFSDLSGGDFKSHLKKLNHKVTVRKKERLKAQQKRNPPKKKISTIRGKGVHKLVASEFGKTHNILVPSNREVIVEGVSRFILSRDHDQDRGIGYYEGRKLNNMTLTFTNNTAVDVPLTLFDPSMPMDYLWSNSINVNDLITIAGGQVKYTNLLYNLLANPTMIVSAQIVVSGANTSGQLSQVMQFNNQNIAGLQAVEPINISLALDLYQWQGGILNFEIMKQLHRPFIPDGMDTISYTVLAGNTVTLNFFYKQVQIKNMVYKEARAAKNLL